MRVPKFRRTRTLIAGVTVTLGISLLGSLPANAAPEPAPPTPGTSSTPSTSGDAKTAWENSSHLAEIASEQVNGAKQAQIRAEQGARRAATDLVAAESKVTATRQSVASATATVDSYQSQLDAFASASFRGANLSQLGVILTAKSAEDFLDESTVMNRVAEDTKQTMQQAIAAKTAAAAAKTDAEAAESASLVAKTQADQASAAAATATATASGKKSDLDAAVARYKDLYNKLSAQEKAAAAAAAEKVRQESLARAAAAQAQADADAAAAAKAAATTTVSSATGSTPSPSGSAAAAAKAAPIQGGDSAGQIAAAAAMTKIGFAYVYAADGPNAYDCSGLTTWAWAQAGISIPRVSYEQANFPEVPLDQLQPGDLVTYYSPVSHVAMYVGGGMVVSAADESLGIIYVPVERGGPDATGHRVPRG
ncbi:cell wall-associated NlpC family hydrolase [Nakamurella sp. UYEF19]|uniref:C40 family peptidase n=1 Tax=Nakamurella sp. UYEF19 TaxID=1756392 RepID=UPI003396B771